ncbi:glycosaminoglycan xylosylkinase-like [Portunus trituberculatus]|uniref:glycosaminoglycan xylosylkinase-like n=1 Tax=Portunus trituberculatus TaxID=210409 RepID=UPI001E1CC0CB|nr:glycosaminoglycan xylosylkinase-like [Portunus trituberculatus]
MFSCVIMFICPSDVGVKEMVIFSFSCVMLMLVFEKWFHSYILMFRYSRDDVIEGVVYAGLDRHNAEVAAFHLGRLLALPTVPLTVGRRVSLREHILPVASRELATTFFKMEGGEICFYGVCQYCNKNNSVCDNGALLESAVMLWLPPHLPLMQLHNPWKRTYRPTKLAP